MDLRISRRIQFLEDAKKNLFQDYDETKEKIRRVLSDDVLNVAFSLLQKLELINVEIECIDKELKYLKSL